MTKEKFSARGSLSAPRRRSASGGQSNKEKFQLPQKEKQEKPESQLEKDLNLREQYQEQVKIFLELGLIELLPERGKLGIYDINGKERVLPTYREIVAQIEKRAEFFAKKRASPRASPSTGITNGSSS